LSSVADYPKKSEVKPLAEQHMARVRKAPTIEAGGTVTEFVDKIYFPKISGTLAKNTVALYRQAWKRLKTNLGPMRLRDVKVMDVQSALDAIHHERGDELGHDAYMHAKVTCSAIFSMALRLGHHPGPNPEDGTSVRGYGHTKRRENGAYSLQEIKQFLALFPSGQIAVTIGLNAFLALREPELQALLPDDFDGDSVRIHRDTKTGNDECLPVIGPLKRLLGDGWEQVNLRKAERTIRKRIEGTNLRWRGWYAFRRGMATNLFELGVRPEEAALILRNSPEVVRRHYLKLEQAGKKADAMARFEQAYDACAAIVQQKLQ